MIKDELLMNQVLYKENSNIPAVFFSENGLILHDIQRNSPLSCFEIIQADLNLEVRSTFLDREVLFVQGKCSLGQEQLKAKGYELHDPKLYLRCIDCQEMQGTLFRAFHWLNWHERYQHCSRCGTMLHHEFEVAEKKCPSCDLIFYPNLSPAVMVLIRKENQVLLARSAYFNPGIYSAVSGFIDIGETAEAAVHREVKEEVGLEITDLKYFGSQSWPFPGSFMIAFTASYLSGELKIDKNELEDAQWFDIDQLPPLPSHPSISRGLIESALSSL